MIQPPEIIRDFLPREQFETFATNAMTFPHYQACPVTAQQSEDDGSITTFGENLKTENVRLEETMFQAVCYFRNQYYATDFYTINYQFIQQIAKLLNVKKWWIIRINATTSAGEHYMGSFHTDYNEFTQPYQYKTGKTAIYYLNSNNGGTKFNDKDGLFVQSKANTLVKFPTLTPHAGVWCTDAKLRFVVNMNYEEHGDTDDTNTTDTTD
tara:strand:+ start:1482 stop:2111 length:630 start_codon:yes stop_codon:yes gene_type:complete